MLHQADQRVGEPEESEVETLSLKNLKKSPTKTLARRKSYLPENEKHLQAEQLQSEAQLPEDEEKSVVKIRRVTNHRRTKSLRNIMTQRIVM
jgi:hypothetical protein